MPTTDVLAAQLVGGDSLLEIVFAGSRGFTE